MRANSPRRGWRKAQLPTENMSVVGTLLREAGPCMGAGDPTDAHAWFDRTDRPRKVHPRFADGWRATLVFYADGTCSLSQALKLKGEIRAGVASPMVPA